MSLSRLCNIPKRIAHTLAVSNRYFLTTSTNTTSTSNTESDTNDDDTSLPGYSSVIAERPERERGRTMRIYSPARAAGQQGTSKVGKWAIQPENPGQRWGNPLMGWTSTRDPMQSMVNFDYFDTKEAAITWCKTNGFQYYVEEPKTPKRKPQSYAATFGKNGLPRK